MPWTRLLCTFTLLLHQGNLLSNVFFLVSATIFLQIYRTGQWSYEIYPHFHQKMKRRIRFFLFLNRFYFQCVLFEASIMLLNFRKKSPQSLPPQFQGNAYNVFKEIKPNIVYREMNQPCQFLNFFDGHDIWYRVTIGYLRINIIYLAHLPVADILHVISIFLFQAFSWCCRSLFCIPLHFHPRRRREKPAEGYH